jgi:hypothetical protein
MSLQSPIWKSSPTLGISKAISWLLDSSSYLRASNRNLLDLLKTKPTMDITARVRLDGSIALQRATNAVISGVGDVLAGIDAPLFRAGAERRVGNLDPQPMMNEITKNTQLSYDRMADICWDDFTERALAAAPGPECHRLWEGRQTFPVRIDQPGIRTLRAKLVYAPPQSHRCCPRA